MNVDQSNFEMTIRLERKDGIPAFGAFLRCEDEHDDNAVIWINVKSSMCPYFGESVIDSEEIKRGLIQTIMHEFGHALESHFRIPVNEEAIEKACTDWKSYFDAQPEGQQNDITPEECFLVLSQQHPILIEVIQSKIEKKHCKSAEELARFVGNRDDDEFLTTLILGSTIYLWNRSPTLS